MASVAVITPILAATACEPPAQRPAERATAVGQWIWSSADAALWADAARSKPGVVPTVWIGTIHGQAGRVMSRLALAPSIVPANEVAVVIRLEDSFTPLWTARDSAIATAVDSAVTRLVRGAVAAGVTITEVQLDYDCPVRLLERWGRLVAHLSRNALAGRTVWLTSLVAHMRVPSYGDRFRDHVAGHIVQVFDTGDRMSSSYARRVQRLATDHRMPFRLGVAAFERRLPNGQATDHAAWFAAVPIVARSPWYRGVWVFPGGRAWVPLLE